MSRYLESTEIGNILVDTVNDDGFFDVLPLRHVLERAACRGQPVVFSEPYGMVEASAQEITHEEAQQFQKAGASSAESTSYVLSQMNQAWCFQKPDGQSIVLKL